MRSLLHSSWLAGLLLMGCVLAGPVQASDKGPLPMSAFWPRKELTALELSPDGKRLAGVGSTSQGAVVVLVDVETLATELVLRRSQSGARPRAVHWINHDLLAVDYAYGTSTAIDLKGRHVSYLGSLYLGHRGKRGESLDWVLAYHDDKFEDFDLVNARTEERIKYRVSLPGRLYSWAFDAAGALRAVSMVSTPFTGGISRIANWYRDDESSPWQKLLDVPMNEEYWLPMRVLSEPHQLAVYSREGRDTYAVFRYDTATLRHVEVMAGHPTEDVLQVQGLDRAQLAFVTTMGARQKTQWFDAERARIQQSVDGALPERANVIRSWTADQALVFSYADVDPGRWYLLNTSTGRMREVAALAADFDYRRMQPTEIVQYAARDGLNITGFLTRPARTAAGPAPMVVLIHGGPRIRDYWGFDSEVQLLASRGYAVFQPQFRGSEGFGRRHLEAGYRQWGRAMQDDITDGVNLLVERGVADKARICIYGTSYGGYAALWGLISTPDLYRCGASMAGVSDLMEQLSFSFFNDSTIASREINRKLVGDPETMKDQLSEVSPILHADRIKSPLLIAHGDQDQRVLFSQSRRMVERLRELRKDVEWMPFEGVGHGFYYVRDELKFETALLKFLQRHIGGDDTFVEPAKAPAAAASADSAAASAALGK